MKRLIAALGLSILMSFTALAHAADKLVIAVQPTASLEELSSQSKEIKDFLQQKLGMEVELLFPTSYAGVIEALHYGHAQVAFMGSWPALLAAEKAGAKVLLAEIREVMIGKEKQEKPYYFSYWVVNKNSTAKSLLDLKGKKASFPSQLSSSGYVAPVARMVELNLITPKDGKPAEPKDYFSDVLYAGGYAQGWEALKAGQVDVTVIAGDVAEKLYHEVLDNTNIVEKQGPIPSHAVVVAKDVSPELREKIKAAFLEFNQPEYRKLMRKFISGIFIRFEPAGQEHLEALKKMVDLTGVEFTEKKK
jgi:phosphonate transport system substrate-binding protein